MSIVSSVTRLVDDFISLLLPRSCFFCGIHLVKSEEIICTSCYIRIPRTNWHKETGNDLEKVFWGRCDVERAAAFALFVQGGVMQKLIHNLKYNGMVKIGLWLGKLYGNQLLKSGFLDGIDLILPVPLHPSRQRKRGYNQSRVIADGISSATGIEINDMALIRTVRNQSQTSRSRFKRWQNVGGIFAVREEELIEGKTILLVDDVITTGSTIEGCVSALKRVDRVRVVVVSLASSLKG